MKLIQKIKKYLKNLFNDQLDRTLKKDIHVGTLFYAAKANGYSSDKIVNILSVMTKEEREVLSTRLLEIEHFLGNPNQAQLEILSRVSLTQYLQQMCNKY